MMVVLLLTTTFLSSCTRLGEIFTFLVFHKGCPMIFLTWDIQSNLEFNSSWYNLCPVATWTSEIVLPPSWESNTSHRLVERLQEVWSVLGFHPTTNFSRSLEPHVDYLISPSILYSWWAHCPSQWPYTVTHMCPWFFWSTWLDKLW
jgi:hypothetical protein